MSEGTKMPAAQAIRNLLTVFVGGVVAAAAVAGYMVYFWSPSGRYAAVNAVISPEQLLSLSYQDQHPQTGKLARYVVDDIAYHYTDEDTGMKEQKAITAKQYEQFYDIIQKDMSLENPTGDVEKLFSLKSPNTLQVTVKPQSVDGSDDRVKKVLMEVDFAQDGDAYRILLNDSVPGVSWTYFSHPGIGRKVHALFTP